MNGPPVSANSWVSLNGPNDPVVLPKNSVRGDWEVELGVVIGQRASYVDEAAALGHVAGYCLVNDVSEREYRHHQRPGLNSYQRPGAPGFDGRQSSEASNEERSPGNLRNWPSASLRLSAQQ